MRSSLLIVAIVLACAGPAFAQHDHGEHHHDHAQSAPSSQLGVGVSLVAASFNTPLYIGSYQGMVPSLRWANARLAVVASGSMYRLEKNGATFYGLGDVGGHGQVRVWSTRSFDTGISCGVSAPTGNGTRGFGMGHFMVMPSLFASWAASRVRLGGSFGYSRALGNGSHDHAGSGAWPLVSPMMASELSWHAGGELLLARGLSAGLRGTGGIPVDDAGENRVIVAGRVAFREGRVDSAFEVQAGVAGDPFNVRGVVSTALSF